MIHLVSLPGLAAAGSRLAALSPLKKVLLSVASSAFVVELVLRRFAPQSKVYATWKAALERVGMFWTGVILSVVYFLSVGVIGLVAKVLGKDPLDRGLGKQPSSWRAHEPNPLGSVEAARHQF